MLILSHAALHAGTMMQLQLPHACAILCNTPVVLRASLAGLGEPWIRSNYGPDTFSPFDVVGHLIHGERTDWVSRAWIILAHGESRAFEPFDRYAMFEASKGKTIAQLLDEFERLRHDNLAALEALQLSESDLARRGRHPDPNFGPVTLGQLIAAWAVHDLHHIAQICKAIARQYTDEVGPWKAYLGILTR